MKKLLRSNLFLGILKKKSHCIFISPHLDDAIFSAGGLISILSDMGVKTTILNIFTKPTPAPYTLSVKRFLRKCGYDDAKLFYRDRIHEDKMAVSSVGSSSVYMGFVDALWRTKEKNKLTSFISKFIPELNYIYPIYRTSIALGHISKHDNNLHKQILEKVSSYISGCKNPVIFIPLGVGLHTDHIIVREACRKLNYPIVYWTDYPYIKTKKVDVKFISEMSLSAYKIKMNSKQKEKKEVAVNLYVSQLNAIFGSSSEKVSEEEIYYI